MNSIKILSGFAVAVLLVCMPSAVWCQSAAPPPDFSEVLDSLNNPIAQFLFGGTFIVTLLAIIALAFGLLKYGKEIKQLNEFESMSKLASLARTMGDTTAAYGKVGQRLDIFSKDLDDTKQTISTLMSKLNALEDLIETRRTPAVPTATQAISPGQGTLNDAEDLKNWETIQSGWREVRDEIDGAIGLIDGRTRKKYSDAPRYTYAEIINYLKDDGVLSGNGSLDAQNINRLFLKTRPRNARIDPEDVRRFANWKSKVLSELKRFSRNQKTTKQVSSPQPDLQGQSQGIAAEQLNGEERP